MFVDGFLRADGDACPAFYTFVLVNDVDALYFTRDRVGWAISCA
jgi:hypothetical protein